MRASFQRLSILLTALIAADAIGATALPYFRSVCASEQESGFNWRKGAWVAVTFKAGTQTLIQKLDVVALQSKPLLERPTLCKVEAPTVFGTWTENKACYLIRDIGSPKTTLNAEMCSEHFLDDKLLKVSCRSMTFVPDGPYVSTPEYPDISASPKDDYKDSLVLSVGKCSRLAD